MLIRLGVMRPLDACTGSSSRELNSSDSEPSTIADMNVSEPEVGAANTYNDPREEELCHLCMGIGRTDCPDCNGMGFVPSPRDPGVNIDCYECNGEGDFPCGLCNYD